MDSERDHCCIEPVYRRIWSVREPDLLFVGLFEFRYWMFISFERQARVVAEYVKGKIRLPRAEEMLREVEEDKQELLRSNLPMYKFYKYGNLSYFEKLQRMTEIPFDAAYEENQKRYREVMRQGYELDANFASTKKIDFDAVVGKDFLPTTKHF